jgi:hypothetical protein
LTTSWPSEERPWSGHFVADLAKGLADRGHSVAVCASSWLGDPLSRIAGVHLSPAGVGLTARHLPSSPEAWPLVLGALNGVARDVSVAQSPEVWLANWWPTGVVAPQGAPCVAVLHGSDVDLAERLPSGFARGLAARLDGTIAVAGHLARRFFDVTSTPSLGVIPLGASQSDGAGTPPAFADWIHDARPRALTVGREAPGKGLSVAQEAARSLKGVAWAFVTPECGVGPAGIRALLQHADLIVVPSRDGQDLPAEGRPHVLTQALVAGVPVVGGPNRAVRSAVRAAGQLEVTECGARALATAVHCALGPMYASLRARAQCAGRDYEWSAVLPEWEAALASRASERWTRRTAINAGR